MAHTGVLLVLALMSAAAYAAKSYFQNSQRLTPRSAVLLESVPFVMLSIVILICYSHIAQLQKQPVVPAVAILFILLLILSRRIVLSLSLSALILILSLAPL